jgi:thioredoxin-dependent peroxiredoxin
MIDPSKATKGRRMSKKTRKKSPKTSAGKATRAQSMTSVKKSAAKARRTMANKPGKKASKPPGGAIPRASHKTPSKQLKLPGPTAIAPRTAATPKTTAAKTTAAKAAKAKTTAAKAAKAPATKLLPEKPDASATGKSALAEGAKAPAFRLPRDGGETVSLTDFAGRKLVLFFYPRAATPGCTKEAIDFTRLAGAFAESQTAVLGVSADSQKAQEAFRDRHQLATPLVSDEQHGMLEAYGVWGEKSMYGKTFQGILRTTVLIGADGRIIRIWRHVKVDGHADDVLAAVRAL